MNMNEIYETLQGISLSDISAALSRLDESGHALTQTELIWLAAAAAAGLLLWGVVTGVVGAYAPFCIAFERLGSEMPNPTTSSSASRVITVTKS